MKSFTSCCSFLFIFVRMLQCDSIPPPPLSSHSLFSDTPSLPSPPPLSTNSLSFFSLPLPASTLPPPPPPPPSPSSTFPPSTMVTPTTTVPPSTTATTTTLPASALSPSTITTATTFLPSTTTTTTTIFPASTTTTPSPSTTTTTPSPSTTTTSTTTLPAFTSTTTLPASTIPPSTTTSFPSFTTTTNTTTTTTLPPSTTTTANLPASITSTTHSLSHVPKHILTLLENLHPHITHTPTTTTNTTTPSYFTTIGCLPPLPRSAPMHVLSVGPLLHGFQYAVPLTYVPSMQELSVCLRFLVKDISRGHFLMSYATQGQDNALVVFISPSSRPGVGVYVNNVRAKGNVVVHKGVWYGVCVSWSSASGVVELFVDGTMIARKKNKCKGCVVEGSGVVVLGVEQDTLGGGFKALQVSHALITSLNLWSSVLPHQTLIKLSQCYNETQSTWELSSGAFSIKGVESGVDAVGADSGVVSQGGMEKEILSWERTPLAVMGGALLIPLLPP